MPVRSKPSPKSTKVWPRGKRSAGRGGLGGTGFAPAPFFSPMKNLSVSGGPPGDWHVEIKWDGFRAIAVVNEGRVELWSRNHKSLRESYPEVVAALEGLKCTNAVLDGEIVALDARGQARFQLLQGRDAGVSR